MKSRPYKHVIGFKNKEWKTFQQILAEHPIFCLLAGSLFNSIFGAKTEKNWGLGNYNGWLFATKTTTRQNDLRTGKSGQKSFKKPSFKNSYNIVQLGISKRTTTTMTYSYFLLVFKIWWSQKNWDYWIRS